LAGIDADSLLARFKMQIPGKIEAEALEKLKDYGAVNLRFKWTDHQGRNIYKLIDFYLSHIKDKEIYTDILDALNAEIEGDFKQWKYESRDYQTTIDEIIDIESEEFVKQKKLTEEEGNKIKKAKEEAKKEGTTLYEKLKNLDGLDKLKARIEQVKNWEQVIQAQLDDGSMVEFTDDFYTLFNIGNYKGSTACQSCTWENDLNRGLAGYVGNGTNKAVALLDDHRSVITRRIVRLRIVQDEEGNNRHPVIFVEENTQFGVREIDELYNLLDILSQKTGLPVVVSLYRPAQTKKVQEGSSKKYKIELLKGRSEFDYSDTYGNYMPGKITAGLYRQSEPLVTTGPFNLLVKPASSSLATASTVGSPAQETPAIPNFEYVEEAFSSSPMESEGDFIARDYDERSIYGRILRWSGDGDVLRNIFDSKEGKSIVVKDIEKVIEILESHNVLGRILDKNIQKGDWFAVFEVPGIASLGKLGIKELNEKLGYQQTSQLMEARRDKIKQLMFDSGLIEDKKQDLLYSTYKEDVFIIRKGILGKILTRGLSLESELNSVCDKLAEEINRTLGDGKNLFKYTLNKNGVKETDIFELRLGMSEVRGNSDMDNLIADINAHQAVRTGFPVFNKERYKDLIGQIRQLRSDLIKLPIFSYDKTSDAYYLAQEIAGFLRKHLAWGELPKDIQDRFGNEANFKSAQKYFDLVKMQDYMKKWQVDFTKAKEHVEKIKEAVRGLRQMIKGQGEQFMLSSEGIQSLLNGQDLIMHESKNPLITSAFYFHSQAPRAPPFNNPVYIAFDIKNLGLMNIIEFERETQQMEKFLLDGPEDWAQVEKIWLAAADKVTENIIAAQNIIRDTIQGALQYKGMPISDFVALMGGDEFTVVIDKSILPSESDLATFLVGIKQKINQKTEGKIQTRICATAITNKFRGEFSDRGELQNKLAHAKSMLRLEDLEAEVKRLENGDKDIIVLEDENGKIDRSAGSPMEETQEPAAFSPVAEDAIKIIESVYKKILDEEFGSFHFYSGEVGNFAPSDIRTIYGVFKKIQLHPGQVLVNLGAGDMRVAVIAAALFKAKARGIELEPVMIKIARKAIAEAIREFKKLGIPGMNQIGLIEDSIFNQPISDADVLFYYEGSGPNIKKIEDKILREAKEGSLVVLSEPIKGFEKLTFQFDYFGARGWAKIYKVPERQVSQGDKLSSSDSPSSKKGGIDLRALPIVTQPMPAIPGVNLSAPPLSQHNINLDTEWQEIQNMLNAGIIPSCERIKEYLEASCQSQDCSQRVDNMLSCLADILRLEEDRVASTEPVLKELLVLLESDKQASEMQLALSKIAVSPKEPRIVVP
jgi:precorrin-6B methylase 2